MPDKQVVLIHPPFSMPDKPYISAAVLYAYLSKHGVDVSVFDLNIEFYRDYLSLGKIDLALDFMEKRFNELDNRESVNSLEIQEYLKLVRLKERMQGEPPPFHLLFNNCGLSNVEQFALFGLGIDIVNTLYFPESLNFTIATGYIRYSCYGSKFSSNDIIHGIQKPSLYSAAIRKIIAGYLFDNTPIMIGISVSFPDQILPAFYAAAVIKEINPEIHICFGGTFVSSHMRDIKNINLFDHVDTFILDEGESPLLELIRCLNESRSYDHIPGLVWNLGDKINKNEPAHPSRQGNKLPLPDYESVDLERYLVNTGSMALLLGLSRGCYWHKCSFCRTGLSFIKHHICAEFNDITAWIKNLVDKYPIRILHFTDDAADPELLYKLSVFLIEQKITLYWVSNMRFDSGITLEKLMIFKEAGCRAIYFGLESCNERILKKMKKGISIPFVEKTLKHCAEIKIPVHLYMIVGFPTETEQEAQASFDIVHEWKKIGLASQVIYNVFEISGWSDIASNPEDYGITNIKSSPSLDLNPPESDFTCSGMERKKAESLCFEFITTLARTRSFSKNDMMNLFFTKEPEIRPHEVRTGFDIDIIQASIERLNMAYDAKTVRFKAIPGFILSKKW
jgi:anaerobic magnesium-protoporphyrin IX monomethyl ester cyclase